MIGRNTLARAIAAPASLLVGIIVALVAPTAAQPALAAQPAAAVAVSGIIGPAGDTVPMSRIAGTDRYATAVAVAKSGFPVSAPIVFLATGEDYPDALAAAPAAAKLGGPLLLTPRKTLPSAVAAELTHLNPSAIVLVGGATVVSESVRSGVVHAVPSAVVTRVAGVDRYDTARRLADYAFGSVVGAYIATGATFPDGIGAAAAAGAHGEPVLLVRGTDQGLDGATRSLLTRFGVARVTIVGSTGVVSAGIQSDLAQVVGSANVTRLGGADRYATSALLAANAFQNPSSVYLATGENFPDALAGAVVAGRSGAPLLAVPATCLTSQGNAVLAESSVTSATIIGAASVVSETIAALVPCASAQPVVHATEIAPVDVGDAPSTLSSGLDAISCPTVSVCRAVGSRYGRPLVATESSGHWSVSAAGAPADYHGVVPGGSPLGHVACASSTYCVAAGSYLNTSKHQVGLIETLSAGHWAVREVPPPSGSPSGSSVALIGVDCDSAKQCVVIGNVNGSGPTSAMLVTDDSGSWSTQVLPSATLMPNSVGHSVSLAAVSCRTGGCTAAGEDGAKPMSAVYGMGSWTVETASDGDVFGFTGVDCPEAGQCTAVAPTGSATQPMVIGRIGDGLWYLQSRVTVPSASNNIGGASPVACATLDFCATNLEYNYGATMPNGAFTLDLVVAGNGTNAGAAALLPSNARAHGAPAYPFIDAMACPRAGVCVAVGEYFDSQGFKSGLLEVFSNGRWRATRIPAPAGETWVDMYDIAGLSCPSTTLCEAVATTNFLQDYRAAYGGVAISIRF
ncbi:MAG TPA: cell wall-binding repeat-containing protein [Humibacter sp.]|nr:cell wall-binding repeat-containing protein [Humibacter sp.]